MMKPPDKPQNSILIAIPAYNEAATITNVINRVRDSMPDYDLLVINDGSRDATGEILKGLKVITATHLCNLGYGRAIQTAIKYALRNGYDALITLDADGQHHPEQIHLMTEEFSKNQWDYLIGSRYIKLRSYKEAPLGRRVGMQLFSGLTRLATGKRVYDTTSGLKVMRRTVFEPLTHWHFVDFHAEAIVYLLRLGFSIGEYPITISERKHGESMYNVLSYLKYPLKTSLLVLLGVIQASLTRRKKL
jgi:glycosyltransferase involved in cell wall biosynthesis